MFHLKNKITTVAFGNLVTLRGLLSLFRAQRGISLLKMKEKGRGGASHFLEVQNVLIIP